MRYSDVARAAGTILSHVDDSNGYQGTEYWLVRSNSGMYTVVVETYGTCALCDTLQAIMDDDDPDEHWQKYVTSSVLALTWHAEREDAIVAAVDLERFGWGDKSGEELREQLRKDNANDPE